MSPMVLLADNATITTFYDSDTQAMKMVDDAYETAGMTTYRAPSPCRALTYMGHMAHTA
jgi:hypothetical protein